MSRQVIVFRHMDGDTPGRLSDLFAAAGYAVETVELHLGQAIPALDRYDLMLVLGGAMHSWQEDAHPWLAAEKQAIREWVGERARPYIGICLGHQVLADALGGEVGLASTPEVGICEVAVDQAGDHPFNTGIAGRHMLPQWHLAEVTRLPAGAEALAASAGTAVQAMAVDSHALGVQFHCEWTLETIRGWAGIDGWVPALEAQLGAGGHDRLLASAAPHMPGIAAMTERLYGNFIRASGLERRPGLTPARFRASRG
jgi:GMP synthase-like glutamine amidotransferase